MRLRCVSRFLLVVVSFAAFAPVTSVAQEVSNAPKVILGGVPFALDVMGGEDTSLWYEVRNAGGTLMGSGTVAPRRDDLGGGFGGPRTRRAAADGPHR